MIDGQHISADLLSAYVLGACTEREADAVSEHLAGCRECERALERLRPAREALLGAAATRPAPAYLKDAVMTEVRREAELFSAARAPARAPAALWRPGLWERLRSPLPAVALAASVALVIVVGAAGRELPWAQRPAVEVSYGEVDARQAPGGDALLETQDGRVRLRVAGLPAPGRGRQYQVWLRTGERPPRPARALFSVDAAGAGDVVLPLGHRGRRCGPRDLRAARRVRAALSRAHRARPDLIYVGARPGGT